MCHGLTISPNNSLPQLHYIEFIGPRPVNLRAPVNNLFELCLADDKLGFSTHRHHLIMKSL